MDAKDREIMRLRLLVRGLYKMIQELRDYIKEMLCDAKS